ncbi:MAG: hypothetical protein M0Q53_20265 [Prolixibacteraceae bacterium]|jgi:hypothetical protein|nr:hypothetical protein [Prolixibacteraceae bacterium]
MNRIPGKHYTTVYSDNAGMGLVKWAGNAPYPTVRVSTYLRSPITENGASYRPPAISLKDDQSDDLFLQLLVAGNEGRTYYKAKTLKTNISGRHYAGSPLRLCNWSPFTWGKALKSPAMVSA